MSKEKYVVVAGNRETGVAISDVHWKYVSPEFRTLSAAMIHALQRKPHYDECEIEFTSVDGVTFCIDPLQIQRARTTRR